MERKGNSYILYAFRINGDQITFLIYIYGDNMKKIIAMTVVLTMFASPLMACYNNDCNQQESGTTSSWAKVTNSQTGQQDFVSTGDDAKIGVIGTGGQTQQGTGLTSKGSDNKAFDSQLNEQGGFKRVDTADGYVWVGTDQTQEGGGSTQGQRREGGEYEYNGELVQVGGAGAINDEKGTVGAGGSFYAGKGNSFADAGDRSSDAGQSNEQNFESGYGQLNQGPNGYTVVEGVQAVNMSNYVVSNGGPAASTVAVLQAGGSLARNNGVGTDMAGAGGSGALGTTSFNGSKYCADGGGEYSATQTHNYEQASQSADGSQWQHQKGETGTEIAGTLNK